MARKNGIADLAREVERGCIHKVERMLIAIVARATGTQRLRSIFRTRIQGLFNKASDPKVLALLQRAALQLQTNVPRRLRDQKTIRRTRGNRSSRAA